MTTVLKKRVQFPLFVVCITALSFTGSISNYVPGLASFFLVPCYIKIPKRTGWGSLFGTYYVGFIVDGRFRYWSGATWGVGLYHICAILDRVERFDLFNLKDPFNLGDHINPNGREDKK